MMILHITIWLASVVADRTFVIIQLCASVMVYIHIYVYTYCLLLHHT